MRQMAPTIAASSAEHATSATSRRNGPTLDSLVEGGQGDAAGVATQQSAHLRWKHHTHLEAVGENNRAG